MRRNVADEGEPYVVVEGRSSDLGPFLLGAALGAGVALLLAPRSGAETREALRERVQSARDKAHVAAEGVAERVTGGLADAREELERRIESARAAVSVRTRQLADAVAAGRAAARDARSEVRDRLAETKADQRPRSRPAERTTDTSEG